MSTKCHLAVDKRLVSSLNTSERGELAHLQLTNFEVFENRRSSGMQVYEFAQVINLGVYDYPLSGVSKTSCRTKDDEEEVIPVIINTKRALAAAQVGRTNKVAVAVVLLHFFSSIFLKVWHDAK